MFVTDRVLDIIIKAKDDAHALAISALNSSHALSVGALSNEIVGLKCANGKLEEQLRYERSRADALVDRLLVRDAKVASVAPAAIAAAVHKDEQAVKKLKEVFDELNLTAVDFPAQEHRSFDLAGGTAVVPGAHSGGY